jgi:hypothetical protein
MGRDTPNTCYDAGKIIIAPILQCVSAAPPTLVHHRFEVLRARLFGWSSLACGKSTSTALGETERWVIRISGG